jgi:multisubunit Na+/H+ antiporter MnhG subunit
MVLPIHFVPTKLIQQGIELLRMAGLFSRNSSSTVTTVFGVLVGLIAIVGTTFLGWEWGASFAEQPIPFVLGAGVAIIALALTVQKRL